MGRGRTPCCDKVGLNRGSWAPEEDMRLVAYIHKYGHGNWRSLPKQAGLRRCGKSCRLRWINYLCPDIKRGNFTKEEEETIISLHGLLGNKWSKIASHLPGRTDNEIKNLWNTHLKKRMAEEPASSSSSTLSSVSCSGQVGLNKDEGCKNPNMGMQDPSSATTCNNEMDLLVEMADIPIEPGLMEDVPGLFSLEVGAMVMADHQHPKSRLERESSGQGESECMRWLADLEFDLDLWGTSEEGQLNLGAWVEKWGDPVSVYFQTSP